MNIALLTTVFIGANLDFFLILIFLLQKYKFKDTFFGYSVGVLTLYILSAIAGQTIQAIVPTWVIGLLGLIPIWFAFKNGEEEISNKSNKVHQTIFIVFLIYIVTCGADNLALYIPVLSTFTISECFIGGIYFILLAFISNILAFYTGKIPIITKVFNKYGELLTRVIYFGIGIFVMYDTKLLSQIFALF